MNRAEQSFHDAYMEVTKSDCAWACEVTTVMFGAVPADFEQQVERLCERVLSPATGAEGDEREASDA